MVCTRSDRNRIFGSLSLAARKGSLTSEQLLEAIRTICDDREVSLSGSSVGLDWMVKEPQLLRSSGLDLTGLFIDLTEDRLSVRIIGDQKLLELVPAELREDFIREVFLRFSAGNSFVVAASAVGISSEAIGDMIIGLLLQTKIDSDSSNTNFVRMFLSEGSGQAKRINPLLDSLRSVGIDEGQISAMAGDMFERPGTRSIGSFIAETQQNPGNGWYLPNEGTMWAILSEMQMREALLICVGKTPEAFFEGPGLNGGANLHDRLQVRLSPVVLEEILLKAAKNVSWVGSIDLDQIRVLPFGVQLLIAQQLQPLGQIQEPHEQPVVSRWGKFRLKSLEFALGLTLAQELPRAQAFFEQVGGVFENVNPALLYRYAWKTLEENPNRSVADFVLERLAERVRLAGYYFGTIRYELRRDRGRSYNQPYVADGGTRYVQDRYQNGYFPKEGEVVLYKRSGTRLTTTVMAVRFIPAQSDRYPI